MTFTFDATQGLIKVQVELFGPSGSAVLQLGLDTGATSTIVNVAMLVALGYDPGSAPERLQVTTGSSIEVAPRIVVQKLVALGEERINFPLLAHTLPSNTGVDGVLGLDFLRAHQLTIDFRQGKILLD